MSITTMGAESSQWQCLDVLSLRCHIHFTVICFWGGVISPLSDTVLMTAGNRECPSAQRSDGPTCCLVIGWPRRWFASRFPSLRKKQDFSNDRCWGEGFFSSWMSRSHESPASPVPVQLLACTLLTSHFQLDSASQDWGRAGAKIVTGTRWRSFKVE